MLRLAQALESLSQSVLEEPLGRPAVAVEAVWRGDELLPLWGQHGREDLRMNVAQRAAEPDIEEVRQIRVADVVVVRRVGADERVVVWADGSGGVELLDLSFFRGGGAAEGFSDPLDEDFEAPAGGTKDVGLGEVPCHRQRLAGESPADDLHLRIAGPRRDSR